MSAQNLSVFVAGFLGEACEQVLEQANRKNLRRCDSLQELSAACASEPADVVIIGNQVGGDGRAAVAALRQQDQQTNRYTALLQCITDTQLSQLPTLLIPGVDDYLICPLEAAALHTRLEFAGRLSRIEAELMTARDGLVHREHSLHDPLTGLGNWRYLVDHLEAMLLETRARGGLTYCASISIDEFTELNERHDEAARNDILKEVTARLRKTLRPSDIIARTGEHEFGIALRYADSEHTRPWIFERVLRAIAYPPCPTAAGENITVTASVGVSCKDGRNQTTPYELLTTAADNMRTAQHEGGNTLII